MTFSSKFDTVTPLNISLRHVICCKVIKLSGLPNPVTQRLTHFR